MNHLFRIRHPMHEAANKNRALWAVLLLVAAFILQPAGASSVEAREHPTFRLAFTFLGQEHYWPEYRRARKSPARDWVALARMAEEDARDIASALGEIADRENLDDYGLLMAVRAVARSIDLGNSEGPVRFHDAWGKSWNEHSRAIFVAAVLNRLGYRAIALEKPDGAVVGLPVDDPGLNARTQTLSIERTFFFKRNSIDRTYLLWDIDGRLGAPAGRALETQLLSELSQIVERDPGKLFQFDAYRVPERIPRTGKAATFRWPGGRVLSYRTFPEVAEYLRLFPEHHFAARVPLEREEMRRSGLADGLARLAAEDEEDFVTGLLQAVQGHFTYTLGPLRTAPEILNDQQGDCDQIALILALVLLESGYSVDALRAVFWEDADHLGLALRPRNAPPKDGGAAHYKINGKPYYVIDPTYYSRRNDELVTRWGDMDPENRKRTTTIYQLGQKP
jgi:hypothetical protein